MPRKFKVDIAAASEADVTEICEYIAQDKPDAATAFVRHLEEQIGTLERFPERCPLIPGSELLGAGYATFSRVITGSSSRSSAPG